MACIPLVVPEIPQIALALQKVLVRHTSGREYFVRVYVLKP
jgi:hypothetical protein